MSNWLSWRSYWSCCGSAALLRFGGMAIWGMLMPVLWREGCSGFCCWAIAGLLLGGERTLLRGTISVGEDCLPCICTCYYWAYGYYWDVAGLTALGVEFAPGLVGCWAAIGDCLEGHEIGEGSSTSINCLFFWFTSSSNGRFTCCFYFSSDMYSSGELEFD